MSLTGWIVLAVVLFVLWVGANVVEVAWAARRHSDGVPPRGAAGWDTTTAAGAVAGDVLMAFELGPKPRTVVTTSTLTHDATVTLIFTEGRQRSVRGDLPVRRYRSDRG